MHTVQADSRSPNSRERVAAASNQSISRDTRATAGRIAP